MFDYPLIFFILASFPQVHRPVSPVANGSRQQPHTADPLPASHEVAHERDPDGTGTMRHANHAVSRAVELLHVHFRKSL